MKRVFWITVVVFLVSVVLTHVLAAEADEAETARRFCEDFLAANDEAIAGLMDEALVAAMTPVVSQEVRDVLSATLGPVEEIGAAWYVDEVQGYRRYRVALVEYGQIEETLAPLVLDLIRDWILERAAPRPEEAP